MQLRSGIAMAVVPAGSCISNSTLSISNSTLRLIGCGPEKQTKKLVTHGSRWPWRDFIYIPKTVRVLNPFHSVPNEQRFFSLFSCDADFKACVHRAFDLAFVVPC